MFQLGEESGMTVIPSPPDPKIFSPPYLPSDYCECGHMLTSHLSGGKCYHGYCRCQGFKLKGKLLVVTFEMIDEQKPEYCVCKNYEDYCEAEDHDS